MCSLCEHSPDVWVNRGQHQSLWLSTNSASVIHFFDGKWREAFLAEIYGHKRKEKAHDIVWKCRVIAVLLFPKVQQWVAFWKQSSMFCRTIILLKSPSNQQWSPWAFQRFWCSTGFSSCCPPRPSLRNIGGTVASESFISGSHTFYTASPVKYLSTQVTSSWPINCCQWCCSVVSLI